MTLAECIKEIAVGLFCAVFLALAPCSRGSTCYVWTNSPADGPGTNWATACHNIQEAVDSAAAGDRILVTNGVYATGARATPGGMLPNRIVIAKAISVQSVNGPDVTIILGQGPNGPSAVRCVYLGSSATLAGFTLSQGSTLTNGDYGLDNSGGAVYGGTLNRCVLLENTAQCLGGGAMQSILNGCAVARNIAGNSGGGCYGGALANCTVIGNRANSWSGGGTCAAALLNCIVFGNASWGMDPNQSASDIKSWPHPTLGPPCAFTCTTPDPGGAENITKDPALASLTHLAAGSPCLGSGNFADCPAGDVDGKTWANPPCMGCDQYAAGGRTGALSVAILAETTTVGVQHGVACMADIRGLPTRSVWFFGDGVSITNQPIPTHAWTLAGDYSVDLTAFNDTYPTGISATVLVHVVEEYHYVAQGNTTPLPPYCSWATAATNIQDAVDACLLPSATVLVSNGVYTTGSRITPGGSLPCRIVVTNTITVRSVNGPEVTAIVGSQPMGPSAVRCVYLGANATLAGFTLTNGATATSGNSDLDLCGGGVYAFGGVLSNCVLACNQASADGGGAECGTLNNCTLSGNSASWGGGVELGTLFDCAIVGNSATARAGGSAFGTLVNCTLAGNYAGYGGGSVWGTLVNCTLNANTASLYGGGSFGDTLLACTLTSNSAVCGGGFSGGVAVQSKLIGNSASEGGGADQGSLTGCLLTNNIGSGAGFSTLLNCTLIGNTAPEDSGGGANSCSLANCMLIGNTATYAGGGACDSSLANCTLVGNFVSGRSGDGGGAADGSMVNCILYSNSAAIGPNFGASSTLNDCCTWPLPAGGTGNIAADPVFVNYAGGDLHLSSASPCINAGVNSMASGTTDLDGNPRILAGVVDMGAYESPYVPIDVSAGTGGSISPSGRVGVLMGSNQSFQIVLPGQYAAVRSLNIDGVNIGPTNAYTFSNVTNGHTVSVTFMVYPDTKGYAVAFAGPQGNGNRNLSWTATNGWYYTLQQTRSLTPASWSNVPPNVGRSGMGLTTIVLAETNEPCMFYRLTATDTP